MNALVENLITLRDDLKGLRFHDDGNVRVIGDRAVPILADAANTIKERVVTAWLIEWPAGRNDPVRYWEAGKAGVIDPNHATRLSRRDDADAIIAALHLQGAKPVEHMWAA